MIIQKKEKDIEMVKTLLYGIFENEDHTESWLSSAYFLYRKNMKELFQVWTGSGGNGKVSINSSILLKNPIDLTPNWQNFNMLVV